MPTPRFKDDMLAALDKSRWMPPLIELFGSLRARLFCEQCRGGRIAREIRLHARYDD